MPEGHGNVINRPIHAGTIRNNLYGQHELKLELAEFQIPEEDFKFKLINGKCVKVIKEDDYWVNTCCLLLAYNNKCYSFFDTMFDEMLIDLGYTIQDLNFELSLLAYTNYDNIHKESLAFVKDNKIKQFELCNLDTFDISKAMDRVHQGIASKQDKFGIQKFDFQKLVSRPVTPIESVEWSNNSTKIINVIDELFLSNHHALANDIEANKLNDPTQNSKAIRLTLIRKSNEVLGLKYSWDDSKLFDSRTMFKLYSPWFVEKENYDNLRKVFNLESSQPPNNFDSLIFMLNAIYKPWSDVKIIRGIQKNSSNGKYYIFPFRPNKIIYGLIPYLKPIVLKWKQYQEGNAWSNKLNVYPVKDEPNLNPVKFCNDDIEINTFKINYVNVHS